MWAYFDSSALVKRYIEEAGRREVLQPQDSIFVSADNRQTDVATILGMNARLIA